MLRPINTDWGVNVVRGRVLWWRFVVSAGSAGLLALGIAVAIIGGAIPVGFASDDPIAMSISGGTADGLSIDSGSLESVGGGSAAAAHTYGARIHLTSATLSGLCLAPEIGFPGTPFSLGIRLRTSAGTRVDDVTIGTSDTKAHQISLPPTSIGSGVAVPPAPPLAAPPKSAPVDGMQLRTEGRSDLGQVDADLYNLKLVHGMDFNSLSAGISLGGSASCT